MASSYAAVRAGAGATPSSFVHETSAPTARQATESWTERRTAIRRVMRAGYATQPRARLAAAMRDSFDSIEIVPGPARMNCARAA